MDTALAQLEHRRRTLPEHGVLAGLQTRRAALADDLVEADTRVSDLEREQERAEADLEPVRERLARNQKRIADGSVADAKALSSMVDEVGHLRRRISTLEDAELEVMEQLETALARRTALQEQAATLEQEYAATAAKRDAQLAELDGLVADRRHARGALAPEIPTDLLGLYDKLRPGHGGVAAAELRHRRCTGCQLEVNAADLRAIAAAAPDEVVRCEECGRVLVRTDESGL